MNYHPLTSDSNRQIFQRLNSDSSFESDSCHSAVHYVVPGVGVRAVAPDEREPDEAEELGHVLLGVNSIEKGLV